MIDLIQLRLECVGYAEIKPKGRSMLPFLKENRNRVVVVEPKKPIKKYDIVLYKHEGVYVLHRVIKIKGDTLTICGDNSLVTETKTRDEIVGVAEKIIYADKAICADNPLFRGAAFVWHGLGVKKIAKKTILRYNRYCVRRGH